MSQYSTRAFSTSALFGSRSLLPKSNGCNVLAFSARKGLEFRASRRCSTVVAASNPVAEVQQTLERTVSTVADTVKGVATEVSEPAKDLDLKDVILLQGALKLMVLCLDALHIRLHASTRYAGMTSRIFCNQSTFSNCFTPVQSKRKKQVSVGLKARHILASIFQVLRNLWPWQSPRLQQAMRLLFPSEALGSLQALAGTAVTRAGGTSSSWRRSLTLQCVLAPLVP